MKVRFLGLIVATQLMFCHGFVAPAQGQKPQGGPPLPPTGLVVVPGNGTVALTWKPSVGAQTYSVFRGTIAGNESLNPIATGLKVPNYQDHGLIGAQKYFYFVTASNSSGRSHRSAEAAAPLPPNVPLQFSAKAGPAEVVLSWTSSAGATSYSVYRSITPGAEGAQALKTGVQGTAFVDPSLTVGQVYYYEVTAVGSLGESDRSAEVSATAADPDEADDNGTTPLMRAAAAGDAGMLKALLAVGADVDCADPKGLTALMFAASQGSVDCVTALASNGADLLAQDMMGKTAYGYGAAHPDVIAALNSLLPQTAVDQNKARSEVRRIVPTQGSDGNLSVGSIPFMLSAYGADGGSPSGGGGFSMSADYNNTIIDLTQAKLSSCMIGVQEDDGHLTAMAKINLAAVGRVFINSTGILFPEGIISAPVKAPYIAVCLTTASGDSVSPSVASVFAYSAAGALKVRSQGGVWIIERVPAERIAVTISLASGLVHCTLFPKYRSAAPTAIEYILRVSP